MEEVFNLISNGRDQRNESQDPDRDEDRIETIPVEIDQEIVDGNDEEKGPQEGLVVSRPGWGQGNEFAEGKKGNEGEKDNRAQRFQK